MKPPGYAGLQKIRGHRFAHGVQPDKSDIDLLFLSCGHERIVSIVADAGPPISADKHNIQDGSMKMKSNMDRKDFFQEVSGYGPAAIRCAECCHGSSGSAGKIRINPQKSSAGACWQ